MNSKICYHLCLKDTHTTRDIFSVVFIVPWLLKNAFAYSSKFQIILYGICDRCFGCLSALGYMNLRWDFNL